MPTENEEPANPTDETALHVGRISNRWAELELLMVPLAARLLRTDDMRVARLVMLGLNAAARKNILSALTEISCYSEAQKEQLAGFIVEFDRLRIARNDIIHGHWSSSDATEGGFILRLAKGRDKLKDKFEPKEIEWLETIWNGISAAMYTAFRLTDELGPLHSPGARPMQRL